MDVEGAPGEAEAEERWRKGLRSTPSDHAHHAEQAYAEGRLVGWSERPGYQPLTEQRKGQPYERRYPSDDQGRSPQEPDKRRPIVRSYKLGEFGVHSVVEWADRKVHHPCQPDANL